MISVRRRWLLGAAVGVLAGTVAGVACGWMLATPEASSWVRALSVGTGSTVLGIAVLAAMIRGERRPGIEPDDVWRAIAALSGAWLALESVQLVREAASAVAVPVGDLRAGLFAEYLATAGSGRVEAAAWVCVAACGIVAVVAYRRSASWSTAPVLVFAALALIARPATGHMAQQTLGSLLNAAHVLAAAVWFGVLAALALLVRRRGTWAQLLPRYSALALRCVAILAATGVIDAAVRIGSLSGLFGTGYGRIVLAKTAVLVALLVLAWTWRRTWVPDAVSHRVTAEESLRNAVVEVCGIAVVFGLAAALATAS